GRGTRDRRGRGGLRGRESAPAPGAHLGVRAPYAGRRGPLGGRDEGAGWLRSAVSPGARGPERSAGVSSRPRSRSWSWVAVGDQGAVLEPALGEEPAPGHGDG